MKKQTFWCNLETWWVILAGQQQISWVGVIGC